MYNIKKLETLKKDLGQKIKSERLKKNMKVKDLAVILNVSESYIRSIERGERGVTIQFLLQICDIFKLSISDFFSDKTSTLNERKENTDRENLINMINNLMRIMDMSQLNFILEMIKGLENMRKTSMQINTRKINYSVDSKEKFYGRTNKNKLS